MNKSTVQRRDEQRCLQSRENRRFPCTRRSSRGNRSRWWGRRSRSTWLEPGRLSTSEPSDCPWAARRLAATLGICGSTDRLRPTPTLQAVHRPRFSTFVDDKRFPYYRAIHSYWHLSFQPRNLVNMHFIHCVSKNVLSNFCNDFIKC